MTVGLTDYVPSNAVRSLINSTISGSEYWHSGANGQRSPANRSETYADLVRPDTSIVLPGRGGGGAKVVRKIKRTFKNRTGDKQSNGGHTEQPPEEPATEWKENLVEPPLDRSPPPTTSSPIISLAKASTSTHFQTTAADIDSLITSKVRWDDGKWDENELQPMSRAPVFKAKMNNQESIYEKYASIMPLPPPSAGQVTSQQSSQQATTSATESNEVNSNNNLQSSSHHSIVAPLSSANSNYFNFNSKVVHTLPASRADSRTDKNQRKKQSKQTRNAANRAKAPIQDFFIEAEKVEKKADQTARQVNAKKTVDFTSRVNHEVTPSNNILAHLLKNNPFAIPIGKKTYKVTKKATTISPSLTPTVLTKRMNSPLKYAAPASSTGGFDSIGSSRGADEYTTTPMSALTNDNLDNINFKAKPSTQDWTWGRRVQASNNLISKTNSKANQLAKRNEWSGNDEQKDSINDKLAETNAESDEESVENDENTNEDTATGEDLNNEFNKNLAAIRNEESPKFDVVTFKPTAKETNQVKGNLNVKSLPIQIISWRQAINHRKKGKETTDDKPKPFAGERITSAKLVVRKEQQIEREKPSPKAFSKQTTKQPSTSAKTNTFKTTTSPKLITTTKSAYQSSSVGGDSTGKRTTQSGKSTRSPMNAFGANRKMPQNEAYVAPPQTKTKPAVSAQLFQEYEDEKENFREELEENYVSRQSDHTSPKKENRVKYAKNQEFRKKSLNLIEEKNDNSVENNDQAGKIDSIDLLICKLLIDTFSLLKKPPSQYQ